MARPRKPNVITPSTVDDETSLFLWIAGPQWPVRYIFDAADLAVVQTHHWYAGCQGRLCTHTKKTRETVYLARLLLNAASNERVRHADGDVRDLRRGNLIRCTNRT